MKKILVITITRDRIETTKRYIGELAKKGGYEFKHIIVDNGSTDGTVGWLKKKGYEVISNIENEGIVRAWIRGVNYALKHGYIPDYVMKYDDDCEIATEGILEQIMKFYEENGDKYVVGPLDLEILHDYVPHLVDDRTKIGSFNVKITTHIGGMFTVMPYEAFKHIADKVIEKDQKRGEYFREQTHFKNVYLTDLKTYHRGVCKSVSGYKF